MKTILAVTAIIAVSLQILAAPLEEWQGNYWMVRNQEQGEITSASGGIPIFHRYYNKIAVWEAPTNGYPQVVQIESHDTTYDGLGQQQTGWLRKLVTITIRLASFGNYDGVKITRTWPVGGGHSTVSSALTSWEINSLRAAMLWEEFGQKDSHPNPLGGYTSWFRTMTVEFSLHDNVYWEAAYWKFVSDWPTPNAVVHQFFKPAGTPTVRYSYPIGATTQRYGQFRTLVSSTPF